MTEATVSESGALVKMDAMPRPADVILRGSEQAKPLADLIKSQKLSVKISGREYVKAEGWQALAAMNGVLPREEDVVRLDDGTYIATVVLVRISDGTVLTRASAECGADEPMWMQRPNYARRSMAVTRAMGKACRIAFSWVVSLAGYEPTPFEEVDGLHLDSPRPAPAAAPAPAPAPARPHVVDADEVPYEPRVPFGKNKDVPLKDLSDSQITWYVEYINKQIEENPNDQRNKNFAEDLEMEISRRQAIKSKLSGRRTGEQEIPF
jgi:hypothetical protein